MDLAVSEHPVLIPTVEGLAGGIVCEPAEPRAALLLLQGGGRSGRSGFDSHWARLSRTLAALGTTVLRYDFCREGDSSLTSVERDRIDAAITVKAASDLALLREVAAWFRQRTEGLGLIVAGSCYGARLGLELAAERPPVAATLLVVPYLRRFDEGERTHWRERMQEVRRGGRGERLDSSRGERADPLDPACARAFEGAVRAGPCWVWIGERDAADVVSLLPHLGDSGLEVEVEPGAALYPGNDPDVQGLIRDRLAARVGELLSSLP